MMLTSHAAHRVPGRADCKYIVSSGCYQNIFLCWELKKNLSAESQGLVPHVPKCRTIFNKKLV